MYMVADGGRRGYQHLLDAFWDEARGYGLPLPTEHPIKASSFCTARPKITPELLRNMLHELAAKAFDSESVSERWHGRRVFAVDGAKINLQRSPDLNAHFGTPEGAYCPQLMLSVLLDVCAKFPVDLMVSPFASCERADLLEMLPSLAPEDVLVLDRGYPSHDVLQTLVQEGIDFLIRVPSSNTFGIIDEMRTDECNDRAFLLEPPSKSPSHWRPLNLRAVRITAPDGTQSFFLTTLRRAEFSRRLLSELYHMRWEVEEHFKLLKGPYIGQAQFRSKSPSGVLQEVHALVLFIAITRLCMCTAAQSTGTDYESLSQKAAVLGVAAYVTRVLLPQDVDRALSSLQDLLLRIVRAREKKRPRRSYPRRSLQPLPRWGPTGRRGA